MIKHLTASCKECSDVTHNIKRSIPIEQQGKPGILSSTRIQPLRGSFFVPPGEGGAEGRGLMGHSSPPGFTGGYAFFSLSRCKECTPSRNSSWGYMPVLEDFFVTFTLKFFWAGLNFQMVRGSYLTWVLMLAFLSCDVIPESDRLIRVDLPAARKKILIEDYTGMKCPNCPKAAEMIDSLKVTWGDSIIPVSIHTGFYAVPSGIFVTDFRTEAGNTFSSEFNIEAWPTGMVNRTLYKNKLKLDLTEWNGAVLKQMSQESPVGIKIYNKWLSETRKLQSTVEISIFDDISQSLKWQIWLVEDSISAPQVSGSAIIYNYIHRHVFRGSLNGTWGEDLTGVEKDAVLKKSINFYLPDNFKSDHCEVIAFVYQKDDKAVLQVNAAKF